MLAPRRPVWRPRRATGIMKETTTTISTPARNHLPDYSGVREQFPELTLQFYADKGPAWYACAYVHTNLRRRGAKVRGV